MTAEGMIFDECKALGVGFGDKVGFAPVSYTRDDLIKRRRTTSSFIDSNANSFHLTLSEE